jgi:HEAT repeat protein
MLADADPVVVAEAVRMLGQLRDRDALPDLHALLSSPIESTRFEVLEALCSIGDPESLPMLRRAVFDPSPLVRARAVLTLGVLTDHESADLLRGILASERSTVEMRAHALLVLMVLGRESDLEAVLAALQEVRLYDFLQERRRLDDAILRGVVERVKAADCIEFRVASMQSRAELEATLVQELASTTAPERRVRVLATLAALGAESTYPAVWRTFHKDPAEDVRVAALRFLARSAPPDEFMRLLVDALHDLQPRVRAEAMRHLHDVPSDRVLSLVRAHLSTADAELRATLIDYLAALPEATLDLFMDGVLGDDLGIEARDTLVRVLGRSRHRDAPALLANFLEAEAPELRRAAVETLQQVPALRASEMIERCFQDPDVRVRCGAVDAAAGLGATHGVPILRRALVDPAPAVRRAALLRLARLAPHECVPDFTAAVDDADADVRAAALAALVSEGSQPIEDDLETGEIAAVAAALGELGSTADLERRLAAADAGERVGALKALVLREPSLRARLLASARVDPSVQVRNVAERLGRIARRWPAAVAADPIAAAEPPPPAPTLAPSPAAEPPPPAPTLAPSPAAVPPPPVPPRAATPEPAAATSVTAPTARRKRRRDSAGGDR